MAFNPAPEVQVARDAARKLGDAEQCVVVALNRTTGTVQVVSYGRTRALCDGAKLIADVVYEAVVDYLKADVLD
jgi:hypothetical protein